MHTYSLSTLDHPPLTIDYPNIIGHLNPDRIALQLSPRHAVKYKKNTGEEPKKKIPTLISPSYVRPYWCDYTKEEEKKHFVVECWRKSESS